MNWWKYSLKAAIVNKEKILKKTLAFTCELSKIVYSKQQL
jgi:hypothetical protein